MSDLTIEGDIDLRIAQQVRCYAAAGYKVGLRHLPSRWSRHQVAPEVQSCVRDGAAAAVDPSGGVDTELLLIHEPQLIASLPEEFEKIHAGNTMVVQSSLPGSDLQSKEWLFGAVFGQVAWVPTDARIRKALEIGQKLNRIEPLDWRPVARIEPQAPRIVDRPLKLGWLVPTGGSTAISSMPALYPQYVFGGVVSRPNECQISFDPFQTCVRNFLRKIDVLAYLPHEEPRERPDATLTLAMAMGKAVLTIPSLREHYGRGPIYCDQELAETKIENLFGSPQELTAAQGSSLRCASERFSDESHLEMIRRFTRVRPSKRTGQNLPAPTAVFILSGDDAMANAQEALAIGRRLHSSVDLMFVTDGRTANEIEHFGYAVEYIPSAPDAQADLGRWDAWFGNELEAILDAYNPCLAVFFGDRPGPGMLNALGRQSGCQLVWYRQGVKDSSAFRHHFDLIIEPDEWLGADHTRPSQGMSGILQIGPVHLLEREELLSRDGAAAALGIDPNKPSVLVQLRTTDTHRGYLIIERALEEFKRFPDLQISILDRSVESVASALWPSAAIVRGGPISEYFSAFDFSIASADYVTFNSVMAHELPSIFVPEGGSDAMDYARAQFAEDVGAGLFLTEDRLHEFPGMISALATSEAARVFIKKNCRAIQRNNGADCAAKALMALIGPFESKGDE